MPPFKFTIKFYFKIFFPVLLLLLGASSVFAQTNLEQPIPGAPGAVGGPAEYIYYFFQYGLMLVGVLALGALVFGGFLYIASAGNQQRTQLGKDVIWRGISGLLLLLGSYLILRIINPDLTQLKEIRLQTVNLTGPTGTITPNTTRTPCLPSMLNGRSVDCTFAYQTSTYCYTDQAKDGQICGGGPNKCMGGYCLPPPQGIFACVIWWDPANPCANAGSGYSETSMIYCTNRNIPCPSIDPSTRQTLVCCEK